DREPRHAGVVARVSRPAALPARALRVEGGRAPAAVGVLVVRQPQERREDRVLRPLGLAPGLPNLGIAAAEGTAVPAAAAPAAADPEGVVRARELAPLTPLEPARVAGRVGQVLGRVALHLAEFLVVLALVAFADRGER